MTGLLDWIKTPEGQGLLSAAFGGLANARRGAPLNSIGGAGMAGLMGYSGALDRQDRTAQEAQQRQLRDMQMKAAQFGLQKTERDMQTDEAIRAAAGRFATPAMPGMGQFDSTLPPELRTGAAMPSKPASFDLGGFSNALMGIDPMKGIELQTKLAKDTPFGKIDPKDYTGASVAKFAASRNFADLVPVRKMDVVNDQVVNLWNAPPGSTIDQTDPNKPFNRVGGQVVPNTPFQQFELDRAARGAARNSQTVNNIGPKEFEKELGQLDAKQLDKYRTGAEVAQATIGTAQALRDAERQGAYSGGGADAKLAVANLINGLTGVEVKGLVGSQIYNAEASKLVLDRIKQLGANPSNADREFIQKTVPQLATSADARRQMADYMEKKASEQIDLYKRADAYARKNSGLGGFDAFTQPPKPAGGERPKPTGQAFAKMPTANASNSGRYLTDSESGKRYRSNGMQWVEVK